MRGLDRRALGTLVLTVIFVLVMIALSAGQEDAFDTVLYSLLPLSLAAVGALVATRHPENPIGWLFCGMGLWGGFTELSEGYGYYAADHDLRGGALGEWIISWGWIVEGTAWTILILLFPDGRLPDRRWRPAIPIALAGCLLLFVGQGLGQDTGELFSSGENPLGVDSAATEVALLAGMVLLIGALVAAVVSSVRRLMRARGVERLQLKWFAYAGMLLAVTFPLGAAFWYRSSVVQVLIGVALNAMPLAVGVGIMRYRLYDIDALINRTLVYGALTVTLAATYLALVLVIGLAVGQSDLAVAASTLVVAALFGPARARVQAAVDRRFYRRRYDAVRTLETFSGRLRDELDLETLGADLRGVVQDTVQPAHVSLWLRTRR